jgi:hypothetical protein
MSEDSLISKVFNGRYRVEVLLGEAGMGRIDVANQVAIDRLVALKVVRPWVDWLPCLRRHDGFWV